MSSSQSHKTPPPQEALGSLLTRLRGERNLAQKEVAHRAGIDGSTLSRLESGERGVSREVIGRICDVLRLDRNTRLEVELAAGLLTEEAAALLSNEELARLALILNDPALPPVEAERLKLYVRLALDDAAAIGR